MPGETDEHVQPFLEQIEQKLMAKETVVGKPLGQVVHGQSPVVDGAKGQPRKIVTDVEHQLLPPLERPVRARASVERRVLADPQETRVELPRVKQPVRHQPLVERTADPPE